MKSLEFLSFNKSSAFIDENRGAHLFSLRERSDFIGGAKSNYFDYSRFLLPASAMGNVR